MVVGYDDAPTIIVGALLGRRLNDPHSHKTLFWAANTKPDSIGRLLREARVRRQLRQEDVWAPHTPVARATYRRWESGQIEAPNPADVRAVCLFLGINPARAAIALGLTTMSEIAELFSNGTGDGLDDIVWHIGDILRDPKTPLPQRAALRHAVQGAFSMWQSAVSMTEPREPSGEELVKTRVRVSKRTT